MKILKRKVILVVIVGFLCSVKIAAFGQSTIVINPTGGTNVSLKDGLKIQITTNAGVHVYREDKTQYFNGVTYPNTDNSYVQTRFCFERAGVYNSNLVSFTVCNTTPAIQNGNDWTASMSGYATSPISGQRFYVIMNFSYTHPNKYFAVDYIVRAPSTLSSGAEVVHIYLDHDAYILGKDGSMGYYNKNSSGELVGDYRDVGMSCSGGETNPRYPSHHGFKADGVGFRSYYTGAYNARMTMNASLELQNIVGNTCFDDGVAVEFVTVPLNAGGISIRRILHCYGDTVGEFNNVAVGSPIAPGLSTPVTVNFSSNTYNEWEGNTTHPASGIQVIVSGGVLSQDQIMTMSASNGTASQNTHFSYQAGFIIPAGNYSTPQTLTLNNINIIGNISACDPTRYFNINIVSNNCNDLIIPGTTVSARVNINEDDTLFVNQPQNIGTHCAGVSIPATVFSGSSIIGATFSWSATNATAVGLPSSSGTGNIPAFTANNTTTAAITSTITVNQQLQGLCTSAVKTFTITVLPSTAISIHPSTATPAAMVYNTGNFPTLSVSATGANLSYQWYRNSTASNSNGALIPGATNATFTPTSILSVGNHYFYCTITSDCGSLASNISGIHTVKPYIKADTVCFGHSLTFTATPTNGGASPVYQWKRNGVVISGATAQTYTCVPNNGDTITCEMISDTNCADPIFVVSGTVITVALFPARTPITAAGNYVCINNVISLSCTTSGGVWSLSNGNAQIRSSNTANPVIIEGLTKGQVYVTYTVGTTPCQTASTFLLKITPTTAPEIRIGVKE